jgi:Phosphotransferase enzyme family
MRGRVAQPASGHPAALAAMRCGLEGAVVDVRQLEESWKSAVYRVIIEGGSLPSVVLKRCDAERGIAERTLYGDVLARMPVGVPAYLGSCTDDEGSVWLAIEDVGDGEPSLDRPHLRRQLTEWAAALHRAGSRLAVLGDLPDRSARHYLALLRSARSDLLERVAAAGTPGGDHKVLERAIARCDQLERSWDGVQELCARVPMTLVHGDIAEENLRVVQGPAGPRLVALDWEKAGAGCPLIDLVLVDPGRYWELNGWWLGVAPEVYERLLHVGGVLRLLTPRWGARSIQRAKRVERRLGRAMAGAALGEARE